MKHEKSRSVSKALSDFIFPRKPHFVKSDRLPPVPQIAPDDLARNVYRNRLNFGLVPFFPFGGQL
jgi:hypothetical protein